MTQIARKNLGNQPKSAKSGDLGSANEELALAFWVMAEWLSHCFDKIFGRLNRMDGELVIM